jgi:hypothetical protein
MELSIIIELGITGYGTLELINTSRVLSKYVEHGIYPLIGRHYGIKSSLKVGKQEIIDMKYMTPIAKMLKKEVINNLERIIN